MISNKTRACYSLALLAWNARPGLLVSSFAPTANLHAATRSISSTSPISLAMSEQQEQQQQEAPPEQVETINVEAHLEEVRQKIVAVCESSGRDVSDVQLVAVSKTKPLELVQQAYASGHRVFGENYAQELLEKAKSFGEPDVQWHFIGNLQSNKASKLVNGVMPYGKLVVETVASLKLAKKLDNAMNDYEGTLDVFVQVNTSGEESKSGVPPEEVVELCQQITQECERLKLRGIMTIGAPGDTTCLDSLVTCRDEVASVLGIDSTELGLSMGMSNDFEIAIAKGSTNVRVGSTIFGARDYSNKN